MEKPLTIKDAAELLSLNPETLYKWVKQGRMPYYRLGTRGVIRFNVSTLTEWFEAKADGLNAPNKD